MHPRTHTVFPFARTPLDTAGWALTLSFRP
jgi:hypothetical protein